MPELKQNNALKIGIMTICTYVVNYFLRNLLGVLNPQLIETGRFTVEFLAFLSSTYMITYASGQLLNGILGDILSPKKMVFWGLIVGGTATCAFAFLKIEFLEICCFAVLGFSLSMMRGPLMKIISENTKPNHARLICVFFSFASFAGPLFASLIAMFFPWKSAFVVSGIISIATAFIVFFLLTKMENKGILHYQSMKGQSFSSIFGVFKIEKFAFYMVIACIVEICATSISFWIPTYLTNELKFEKNFANGLFSGISVMRAFMPFVALLIFRLTKERDIIMMRVCFVISTTMFASLIFISGKWCNIIVLLLALMSMSCISSLLWSIYIPGLGKTGKVSSVNGVLDCTGYIAAAAANMVFALVASNIGWNGVCVIWSLITVFGFVSTLFVKKKQNK